MSKHKEVTWTDWFFRWLMMFSALLMIAACCPAVHMHYAYISQYGQAFGQRFVTDRRFSMFGATNQITSWTSWFKFKTLVCRRAEEYLRPNALQVVVNIGAQVFASQGDKLLGVIPGIPDNAVHYGPGGAIMGCAIWDLCKNHALDRCYQYTTIAYGGFAFFTMVVIGSITAMVATILQVKDGNAKKKKRKERAEQNTCCAGVIAFLCTFTGFGGWLATFYFSMLKINATSWYPLPNASVGVILGAIGLFIQGVAAILGFVRLKKEESPEGQWQGDYGYGYGYGEQGYGQQGYGQQGYGQQGGHAQIPNQQVYATNTVI
jgi:hypothetical protein